MKILIDPTYFNRWQGGRNYLRNFIIAGKLADLEFVFFKTDIEKEFYDVENEFSFWFPKKSSLNWWFYKMGLKSKFRKENELLFENTIGFQVDEPTINKLIPIVRWIPDFQHVDLPHYFSEEEINKRNQSFNKIANESDVIIVSSDHAKQVFLRLFPELESKAQVIHFAIDFNYELVKYDFTYLKNTYNLPDIYFHFPSQWWKHKNHETIIKAAHESKCNLVLTGNMDDYRFPKHKGFLMKLINDSPNNNVISLGNIPYDDMLSIMWHSKAVINASFYEGWSTTIEEAKALQKSILASDIPIMKEQLRDYNDADLIDPNDLKKWIDSFKKPLSKQDRNLSNLKKNNTIKMKEFGHKIKDIFDEVRID